MQTLADDLESILDKKEEVEASYEAVLAPIKEEEDRIRAELLDTMQKKGWKFARATSGLGFGITNGRKTFAIKKGSEAIAVKWALQEYPAILSVSTAKLAQVLKPMLDELPPFVEEKVGEPFLSVRQQEADEQ